MPEKELPRTVSRPVFNTYALTVCALLTALSVVLARVLTLIPAETTRISLEAVPIVLSGLLFGPIPGAVVGFAADLIGCLFSPFGYNPIFCVPPILYGLLAGAVRRYVTDRPALLRTALAFFPAAIVGSVLWQSMALALVYGGDAKQAFFLAKLVSRSIQFALTGTVDTLIVQNTYGMGYFGVESAYKLLAGQGSSVEKSNITATRTITRENMFAMDKQKALFPFG